MQLFYKWWIWVSDLHNSKWLMAKSGENSKIRISNWNSQWCQYSRCTQWCFLFVVVVLLRKICSELTSVASLPVFCMWVTATAWPLMSCVGTCPRTKPRLPKWSALILTTRPWGQALIIFFNGRMKNCVFRFLFVICCYSFKIIQLWLLSVLNLSVFEKCCQ